MMSAAAVRQRHQDLFLRSRNSPNTSAALGALHVQLGRHRRLVGAQEHVGLLLLAEQHRDRRLVLRAQPRHFLGARLQRGIVGVDRQRELDVGRGIFMAAIEFEIVRQRAQLQQRIPHHRIGALEHPAAADREQRVGGEHRLLAVEHVGDVVERMARRFQHPRQQAADLDRRRHGRRAGRHWRSWWTCRAGRRRGNYISASVRRRRRHGR